MHKSSLAAAMLAALALKQRSSPVNIGEQRSEYDLTFSQSTDFTADKPIHNPRNNRKTKRGSKR